MATMQARFRVGQLVHHKLFDYRGVIIDVDPGFMGADEWYRTMARSRPPKDKPWYHVLVHNAVHQTYVAEQNLDPDPSGDPVIHPDIDDYFEGFRAGIYLSRQSMN